MVKTTTIKIGDLVKLKKNHPCGKNRWQVFRVGMDIGLECQGCGRKIKLIRREFNRRFRGYLKEELKEKEM
ncbi:MAG: DUF951 domain-containing protein [Actinomycetota bacterium]